MANLGTLDNGKQAFEDFGAGPSAGRHWTDVEGRLHWREAGHVSEPIVYIDRSRIREGKIEDVRAAARDLVAFVEANEPQLISYGFFIEEPANAMTVVAVHPDSASLELHMEIGGPRFKAFADLIEMRSIEVFGRVSEKVMQQLRQKAEMLGTSGSVQVHEMHAGFLRVAAATS